jgi:hypothetical protein
LILEEIENAGKTAIFGWRKLFPLVGENILHGLVKMSFFELGKKNGYSCLLQMSSFWSGENVFSLRPSLT